MQWADCTRSPHGSVEVGHTNMSLSNRVCMYIELGCDNGEIESSKGRRVAISRY